MMGFEFDVSRNAINRQKNGVDFEEEQGQNLKVGFLKTAMAT
jgi:uncharacterized DUF497 family protein